jgi:hypothetical protein
VCRGERPEVAGEPLLTGVVEVDIVEHQHLVLVERAADRGDRGGVEFAVDVGTGHPRADTAGDLTEVER